MRLRSCRPSAEVAGARCHARSRPRYSSLVSDRCRSVVITGFHYLQSLYLKNVFATSDAMRGVLLIQPHLSGSYLAERICFRVYSFGKLFARASACRSQACARLSKRIVQHPGAEDPCGGDCCCACKLPLLFGSRVVWLIGSVAP